jgi:hypothetical protein
MEIIYIDNPMFWDYWNELSNSTNYQHPMFFEHGIEFYKEYYFHDSSYEDKSFIVVERGIPLVGAIFCLDKNLTLSGYGKPINYVENQKLDVIGMKAARKLFKKMFSAIWSDNQVNYILLRDYVLIDGSISNLCRSLLDRSGKAELLFLHMINLSKSIEEIHRGFTKSCRHSVNWGLKNLELEIKDSKNITPEDIDRLRELHIKEAGRETRSKESWNIQYSLILKGSIFMVNAFLDDVLVSSALFIHNSKCCLYGVSASSRSLFDKPIGHAVIWKALNYAKEIGCDYFDFGDLIYSSSDHQMSDKENNINRFKKSFGGETKIQLIVNWRKKLPDPSN